MKYSSCAFLARAHIKSGRRSTSVFVLLLLSIVLLTLVLSFGFTMQEVMYSFKNQDPVRRLRIDSSFADIGYTPLSKRVLEEIEHMEHVKSVDIIDGMSYQFFDINAVTDEHGDDCSAMLPEKKENSLTAWSLYQTQDIEVVEGVSLANSPVFSCIVPDIFFPSECNVYEDYLDFQNGTDYLGKTLTVQPYNNLLEVMYYKENGMGGYTNEFWYLPGLKYQFKVVGVYSTSFSGDGEPNTIYVSHETGVQIQEMAVQATKDPNFITEYKQRKSNPQLHAYTVLVDNYKNIDQVINQLEDKKVMVYPFTEKIIPDSVQLLSAVFTGAGNFLTFAILVLAVVNLFLSVSGALADRKGEVGLLKAIGYKDRQVFFCFYLEHVKIALRAFVLGALLSGAAVLCINWINGSGPFQNRIYVIRWEDFWLLCLLSFAIAVLVPLLCQLLMLPRLVKIQPRQAMGQL